MPEPLPHHVFRSVATSVVQRLRAIGVHADYAIVDGYTLIDRDSGEGMLVFRAEGTDGVEYIVHYSSRRQEVRVRDFDFSKYIVIKTDSISYLVVDYARLDRVGRLRVVEVIGEVLKRSNISNTTIVVYDEEALNVKNFYYAETLRFDNNETLKSMLIEAFKKAVDAFIEVNASRLVVGGGKEGGYWVRLEIRDTFDKCADAVKRFVHVYVDEIRKIVPEDIPIYIELEENAKPEYLLPERSSQQPLLIIAAIKAITLTPIIVWRIAWRKSRS